MNQANTDFCGDTTVLSLVFIFQFSSLEKTNIIIVLMFPLIVPLVILWSSRINGFFFVLLFSSYLLRGSNKQVNWKTG